MQANDWFATTSFELEQGVLHLKPGVRGHPDLPPGAEALIGLDLAGRGPFLDASGTAGLGALLARSQGLDCLPVQEPSAAALGCALSIGPALAALPWDEPGAPAGTMLLLPQADRGNQRMFLEIERAAAALPDGRLLLVSHKDGGGKRLEKLAAGLFSETRVIRREKGWRVLECLDGKPDVGTAAEESVSFEAAGLELTAVKGTFAAGKLDPGTARLLETMGPADFLAGRDVLDLGCGYGLLALKAALKGASVTALDDDLAAVRSTSANAARLAPGRIEALHSDLDSGLGEGRKFDTVLMNPPFHVGRGVRFDVSRAFVEAAGRRLVRGGELWLVANRALPYEPLLAGWRESRVVADERGFKVIRAVR